MEDGEIVGIDTPEVAAEELAEKPKRKRKAKIELDESVTEDLLKAKPKKPKKVKEPTIYKTLREIIYENLGQLEVETIKKPWMSTKTFRLVNTAEDLREWADRAIANKDKYFPAPNGEMLPVIAVDTETTGLDVRIVNGEINVDIAGVCLSSDGVEGLYVPITHEDGQNISRRECAEILQELFDQSFLVFFNAKFDREVMRVTMGINFREYPYFEDVQVFNFLLDPKADIDVGGKAGSIAQGGLKMLSKRHLGIEQLELEEFTKVKLKAPNPLTGKVSVKTVYAPFNLVPTPLALWYAAGDAICTWLLWKKMFKSARKISPAHEIDHELVDTLGWVERQRYWIDSHRLTKTVKWQQAKLEALRKDMIQITGHDELNPGSSPQLGKILFQEKGFKPYKLSEKTGLPSTDGETLEELIKQHPKDPFLKKLMEYREYAALHPENLQADPRDGTARVFLKQCTVAGGRLAANGGDFEKDGGFGLNIQGIKAVTGNKWVKGRLLLEDIEDINMDELPEYEESQLHESAFVEVTEEVKTPNPAWTEVPGHIQDDWGTDQAVLENNHKREMALAKNQGVPQFLVSKQKVRRKVPGIIKNHLASWLGYTFCLVPGCKHCKEKYTVLKENARGDANEILNLRSLFISPPGWTFFTIDYSNIEMRCAANISGEPKFVNEFIHGEGDFHTLTAVVVFGKKFTEEKDKVKKKALRSMAKVLNFALLYGGTEHTIFENLKKNDPDATLAQAREMVEAYWAGVPVFAEWVKGQKDLAEHELLILTSTGRKICFESALEEMRIHEPTDDEREQYWQYRGWRKKANTFKDLADSLKREGAEAYEIKEARDRAAYWDSLAVGMWKDETTGVRNVSDYNRFIGKIGRLSMNIPLQGLAGDMMRMSLNACRKWARADVGVENVLRLHGSVHDEIDPSIKNEWVPYVLPRLTRLMKLRKLHEDKKWPVPIETDIEFGTSWDIEHHTTGDKDHKPGGYYDIEGMDGYIPMEWFDEFPRLEAMLRDNKDKLVKALRKNLHERTAMAIDLLEETRERKWLIIALQLDEYWRIDEGEDPCTLEEYEAFYGLTRPELPIGEFMGAMPFDLLEAHDVKRLEELDQIRRGVTVPAVDPIDAEKPKEVPTPITQIPEPPPVEIPEEEDSVFAEAPKKKKPKPVEEAPVIEEEPLGCCASDSDPEQTIVEQIVSEPEPIKAQEGEIVIRVAYKQGIPVLRFMDEEDLDSLMVALGRGKKKIQVVYCGEIYEISNVKTTEIPKEYVFRMDQLERIENVDSSIEGFKVED